MEIIFVVIAGFVVWGYVQRINRKVRRYTRPLRPPARKKSPPRQYRPTVSTPKVPRRTQTDIITGKCYVIDGDTIVINRTHIRLFGIDAPELNHPWGKKAKWEMVNMCKGRVITATLDGSASHDRVVATCRLPDGTDLGEELVKRGLAIDWPKFSGGKYTPFEVDGIRKKLWRCHNRQIGKHIPD